MVDTSRIGSRPLVDAPGVDGVASRPSTAPTRRGGGGGAAPSPGGRGTRMLSPNVDVTTLDRTAPRGTYIDLLV